MIFLTKIHKKIRAILLKTKNFNFSIIVGEGFHPLQKQLYPIKIKKSAIKIGFLPYLFTILTAFYPEHFTLHGDRKNGLESSNRAQNKFGLFWVITRRRTMVRRVVRFGDSKWHIIKGIRFFGFLQLFIFLKSMQ